MLDTKALSSAKYYIKKLTKSLKYIKSDKGKQAQIDMINAFVKLVNAYEALALKSVDTELIEKLLLGRFYGMLRAGDAPNATIDIDRMVQLMDDNLKLPKSLLKERVVMYLFTKEIELIVNESPTVEAIASATDIKEWDGMVDNLINQLITQRLWN